MATTANIITSKTLYRTKNEPVITKAEQICFKKGQPKAKRVIHRSISHLYLAEITVMTFRLDKITIDFQEMLYKFAHGAIELWAFVTL